MMLLSATPHSAAQSRTQDFAKSVPSQLWPMPRPSAKEPVTLDADAVHIERVAPMPAKSAKGRAAPGAVRAYVRVRG
mgnify:CR=1 FL=1